MWQLVDTIRLQLYMLHKWSAVQVFIHIIDSTHKNCDTLSFGQVSWHLISYPRSASGVMRISCLHDLLIDN